MYCDEARTRAKRVKSSHLEGLLAPRRRQQSSSLHIYEVQKTCLAIILHKHSLLDRDPSIYQYN